MLVKQKRARFFDVYVWLSPCVGVQEGSMKAQCDWFDVQVFMIAWGVLGYKRCGNGESVGLQSKDKSVPEVVAKGSRHEKPKKRPTPALVNVLLVQKAGDQFSGRLMRSQ